MDEVEVTLVVHRLLLLPFVLLTRGLKIDDFCILMWSAHSFRLLLVYIDKCDAGWQRILLYHW